MKKKNFLINAAILSFTALFLNIVGIGYRVYLSGRIGQSGIGLFQLITSVYMFATTIASSGLSFTITRLVSEALATGQSQKVRRTMNFSFIYAFSLGCIAFSGLFFGAEYIGTNLLGDPATVSCLKILAFGLPFLSISSCLSGFFLGLRKVTYSSIIQIFEEFTQIAITILILTIYNPRDIEQACIALVLGSAIGELLSCICAFSMYSHERKTFGKEKDSKEKTLLKILKITIPISFSAYFRSALTTIENLMIPVSLQKFGYTQTEALSLFGLLKGMVIPVIFFPSVFLSAFSRLLMPEIADSRATGDNKKVNDTGCAVISATLVFSILITGIFLLFSKELGMMIYASEEAGQMIFALAPLIPFMYLDGIIDGMLKGMDEQVSVMKYSLAEAFLRVVLVWFIIPVGGKTAFIITIYAGNIVNSFLSLKRFIKVGKIKYPFAEKLLKTSLAVAAAGIPLALVLRLKHGGNFTVVAIIALTVLLYFIFAYLMKALTKNEIKSLKSLLLGK